MLATHDKYLSQRASIIACVDIKPAAVRHLLLGPVAGGVEVHAGEAPTALAATKSELI